MRIKSTVWQVLAGGNFGAGLLYALGIEGGAQVGGTLTDGQFVTAMVLIGLAVLFMQLGFRAEAREERARRKVHRAQRGTVTPARGAGRTPSVSPSAKGGAVRQLPQGGAFLKGRVG